MSLGKKTHKKIATSCCACSAVACNVAMRILSPKLNRLSHRYSRALYYDAYQSKCATKIISDQMETVI